MSACPPLVLVADDEPAVAWAICRSLESSCRTVPPVFSLVELPSALECHRPAVVLLDVRFQNDESSLDSLPALASAHRDTRFIVHTGCPDWAPAGRVFASGARGYVTKPAENGELQLAIDAVLAGGHYLTSDPRVRQATRVLQPAKALSPCQGAVFTHLRLGFTQGETAGRLGCSPRTVEHHVEVIRQKLGCEGGSARVKWCHVVVEHLC